MRKILLYIVCVLVSLSAGAQTANDDELDSLIQVYHSLEPSDTSKMYYAYMIAKEHCDSDSTIVWAQRLLDLAQRSNNGKYEAYSKYFLSWAFANIDEYYLSIKYGKEAFELSDSLGLSGPRIGSLVQISAAYSGLNLYEKSDELLTKALYYADIDSNFVYKTECMRQLAVNYRMRRMYSKAEEMYLKAIAIDSVYYPTDMKADYFELANLYLDRFQDNILEPDYSYLPKVRYCSMKALELESDYFFDIYYEKMPFLDVLFYEGFNAGDARRREILDSMSMFISEAMDVSEKLDLGYDDFMVAEKRVRYNILSGDYGRAYFLIDSLEKNFRHNEQYSLLLDKFYYMRYWYYKAINKTDSAYYYSSLVYSTRLFSTSIDNVVSNTESLAQIDFDKRTMQRDAAERDRKRKLIFISLFILLLTVVGVWEYFRKRRHNRELNAKNAMLQRQKEEIEIQSRELNTQNQVISAKNKNITDSIHYASLIQQAVLPDGEVMGSMFSEYFLIYRPLNIVAGDFYWASTIDRFNILVCADCTGHGVPGAFVSMLGVSLLNDVVPQVVMNGGNAAQILDMLRHKLMKSLGQDKRLYDDGKRSNMDGMDLSLIMMESGSSVVQYAGAYRPLWIWRDGEIIQYRPDKMPIGLYLGNVKDFTNQEIEVSKGDVLYMFSDGIPDQFGYVDDARQKCRHLSTKLLCSILKEIGGMPLQQQGKYIEDYLDNFKNGYKQLDDNIMIGIKIS